MTCPFIEECVYIQFSVSKQKNLNKHKYEVWLLNLSTRCQFKFRTVIYHISVRSWIMNLSNETKAFLTFLIFNFNFLSGYYKHGQTTMTDWRTSCNLHMSIFYLLFRKHQTLHLRKVKISFWSETFSLKRSEPFPTYKWHLLSNSSEPPCSTIFLSDIMTRQVFVSPDLVPGVRLGILWASRQSDVSSLSYFEWFICSPGLTLWEILFILPTNSLSGEQDELSYFNKNAIPVCNTISSPPSPTTVTSLLTMWKCHWCN